VALTPGLTWCGMSRCKRRIRHRTRCERGFSVLLLVTASISSFIS